MYSKENVNNVLINVSGLNGRHEKNRVSLSRDANLSAGENKVFFSYRIPSCGCAVSYGVHFINASVVYDGEVVSATHSIVLTSHGKITSVFLIENGFELVYNAVRGIDAGEESGYPVVNTTSIPEQPGFETVLAIAALLVVACLVERNKRERC